MLNNPPRLLSLNTYHYRRGGTDAVYFDHNSLFQEAGWEVGVFAMSHPKNEESKWNRFFVEEIELGEDYGFWDKLTKAGKIIYSFEARRKLGQLLDDWQPDVVHAHNIYHHLSPSPLDELRKRGIPVVLTAHDFKLVCPAYKMLNTNGICEKCKSGNLLNVVRHRCIHDNQILSTLVMTESVIHRALNIYKKGLRKVITPSSFMRSKLAEWGWDKNKLHYIPNFVDSKSYTPNFYPGDYFLYFGRMSSEKGIDLLISAADNAGVIVKLAGVGPAMDDLKMLSKDKKNSAVEFMGYCAGEKLHSLIRNARAVVLPARWYENAPISIMESYALGKIVIGSRIGGIPEMVTENETGFLFEPENIEQLSHLLQRVQVMEDNDIAGMGISGRNLVEQYFSPSNYLHNMLAIYEEIGVKNTMAY